MKFEKHAVYSLLVGAYMTISQILDYLNRVFLPSLHICMSSENCFGGSRQTF